MALDSVFSLVFVTRYFASFLLFFLSLIFGYIISLSIAEEYDELKKYRRLIYSISLIPIIIFLFMIIRESLLLSSFEFNYGYFSYAIMISISIYLFFHSMFKGLGYLNERYKNITTQTKFRTDTKHNMFEEFIHSYYPIFLFLFLYILIEIILIWLIF